MAGTPPAPADPGQTPPSTPPPQSPTPPPQAPPNTPPASAVPDVEQDPNLAWSKVVARSKAKHEKGPKTPDTPPSDTPQTPPKPADSPAPKLNSLIGKALKMRPDEASKPADPPATPPADPPAGTPPADPPAEPSPTDPPAGKKGGKKKITPEIDPVTIAREAATAATKAALSTLPKPEPKPEEDPLANFTDDDRHDYEVAKHLATIDPRFKDAPQILVNNLKRAEEYANRWEAANPGKEFDPADSEHDEFFSGISTPWTTAQFQKAAIDLAAEKKLEKHERRNDERIREIEATTARSELKPVVEQRFETTTMAIAKSLGDDVAKAIETSGFSGLDDHDPILGQVLGATLQQLHPFIEAAVHIDDPRIGLNPKDPMHQQWSLVVQQGEAAAVGVRDESGRMFARRADYRNMSPEERAKHWYLTTDHIIQGALEYAADQVQKVTEAQKKQLEKLGFKREKKAPSGTQATPPPSAASATPPASTATKPVSPSAGGGAKIDAAAEAPKSPEGKLMQQISGILFRR